MSTSRANRSIVLLWAGFLIVSSAVVLARLELSYDLTLFLPNAQTRHEAALLDRVDYSPGAQLVFVEVPDIAQDRVDSLVHRLQASGEFTQVLAGPPQIEIDAIPEPLWMYRYLLDPQVLTRSGLDKAFGERALELGLMAGSNFADLVREDPTLSAAGLLDRLTPVDAGNAQWREEGVSRLLLLQSRRSALDIKVARTNLDVIDEALTDSVDDGAATFVSGVGPFSARLSETIEREARWRSVLASLAVMIVVFLAYRNLLWVVFGALPLATGMVCGMLVLSALFGKTHGITLAFGFTLLGVAIDYPLHLFSRSRSKSPRTAVLEIWPTLRLGVLSTVLAFFAIALSGAQGPAQLGVFTAAGLLGAMLTTRFVLPAMMKGATSVELVSEPGVEQKTARLRHWPWVLVALVAIGTLVGSWQGTFFENSISALTPIASEDLARDTQLRSRLGSVDMRHILVVEGDDLEQTLVRTERLADDLEELVSRGLIHRFNAPTDMLPSLQTQRERLAALPTQDQLNDWVTDAASHSGLSANAFRPFIDSVGRSRTLELLTRRSFAGTDLEHYISGAIRPTNTGWTSTVTMQGLKDATPVRQWLEARGQDAILVDLKATSNQLVSRYRQQTLSVCAIAFGLIAIILLWRLRVHRGFWALASVVSAMTGAAAVAYHVSGPLTLFHMMALLLVGGLGLDYALFASRSDNNAGTSDSAHAIKACAASTCLAFLVLAASDIPVLQAIGQVVATGVGLSFALAFLGAKRNSG